MTMRGHCVIESYRADTVYKHISDKRLWIVACQLPQDFLFFPFEDFLTVLPPFFCLFAFSHRQGENSYLLFFSVKWTKFLQKSFVPLFTPLTFVYKLQKQSFLAIDALCSKHNKETNRQWNIFLFNFSQTCPLFIFLKISWALNSFLISPIKTKHVHFFDESAAGEFFSHSFQQTFAPSCFFDFTVF